MWRTWWLSDFTGRARGHAADPHLGDPRSCEGSRAGTWLEGAALLTTLVLLAELPSQRDVPYVVFPVLIWAALRFGPRGAATALVRRVVAHRLEHRPQRGAVRPGVDHRQPALEPALPGHRGADVARARRGHRRAHASRRGAARQRGAIAVGGPVDGGGPHRSRRTGLHHRLQRGRRADPRRRPRALRGRRPEEVLGAALDTDDEPLPAGRLLGDEALATGSARARSPRA